MSNCSVVALVNLAGLSFLGLGVQPGTPDWGRMLFENRNILFSNPVALLLADQRMPQMDGVNFLSEAMEMHPLAKRALLTAYADTNAAIDAINEARVHYYLMKPWDPPEEKLFPALDDMLHDWTATFRPPYEGIRVLGTRWSTR